MVREKKRKLIISRKTGALRKEERAAESNRRQNPMKVKVRRVFFFSNLRFTGSPMTSKRMDLLEKLVTNYFVRH